MLSREKRSPVSAEETDFAFSAVRHSGKVEAETDRISSQSGRKMGGGGGGGGGEKRRTFLKSVEETSERRG